MTLIIIRKILHSAALALILSLSLLFSSCSGFFDFIKDIDEDDDSPEFTEVSFSDDYRNAFGIYLTATDIYGNELSSKSSGASGNSDNSDLSFRAASPLIDLSSSGGWAFYGALVSHGSSASDSMLKALSTTDSGSLFYSLTKTEVLRSGSCDLYIYGYHGDPASGGGSATIGGASVVAVKTIDFNGESLSYTARVAFGANEAATESGSVSLKVKVPTKCTSVNYTVKNSGGEDVTASYFGSGSSADLSSGVLTITLDSGGGVTGIPAGKYSVEITFYGGTSTPIYLYTDIFEVWPGCETNRWFGADGTASEELDLSAGTYKTFFVCGSSPAAFGSSIPSSSASDNNSGGITSPLSSVHEAVKRINASNDGSSTYTVYVDGTVTESEWITVTKSKVAIKSLSGDSSKAVIKAGYTGLHQSLILFDGIQGGTVTLSNVTLDANQIGRCVNIPNKGTLTVDSCVMTGGHSNANGGGILVGANGSVTIKGSSKIYGNKADNNGNNVYISAGGTFLGSNGSPIAGNSPVFDDSSASNGKADVVCLSSSNQFVRLSKTGGGATNFASIITDLFNSSSPATIYLGNTNDAAARTWETNAQISVNSGEITVEGVSSSLRPTITWDSTNNNIFNIGASGNLTLKNLIIAPTSASVRCILSMGTLTAENVTLKDAKDMPGSGLYIGGGEATLDEDCVIENCDAGTSNGGAVYIDAAAAKLTLKGEIKSCKATKGGGICVNNGSVYMPSGSITGCTSVEDGGGIYVESGSVTLKGTAIVGKSVSGTGYASNTDYGNKAKNGGGVYVADGTLTMQDSAKISYNKGSNNGGGIYLASGTVNISSSSASVCNCQAVYGGGLYINGGSVNLYGSVKYNNCNNSAGGVVLEGGTLNTYSNSSISDNTTNIAASNYAGCGVRITGSGATLNMEGGSISDNEYFDVSTQYGTFKMKGDASAGNVCVYHNKYITLSGNVSANPAATITPVLTAGVNPNLNYNKDVQVLSGDSYLAGSYTKFTLANSDWNITSEGKLTKPLSAITVDEIQAKDDGSMIDGTIATNYTTLLGKTIFFRTSNGSYGAMQFTDVSDNYSISFKYKIGSGNVQTKNYFSTGWGFDLDGATTSDSNKDFGLDSSGSAYKFVAYNGAKFCIAE